MRFFGEVGLAHLGERLPDRGQLGLQLLIHLLLANQVTVLHFNLSAQPRRTLLQIVDLVLLFLNRTRQILDLFVGFPSLASLLLYLYLQLIHQCVQFFNLTILVLQLSLDGPLIFRLLFLCVFLKGRLQLIYLIKSVPDFDFVLGVDYLSQAFHLFTETFGHLCRSLNSYSLIGVCLMIFLDLLLLRFLCGLFGFSASFVALMLSSSCLLPPYIAMTAVTPSAPSAMVVLR